jgi:hypothetical protein
VLELTKARAQLLDQALAGKAMLAVQDHPAVYIEVVVVVAQAAQELPAAVQPVPAELVVLDHYGELMALLTQVAAVEVRTQPAAHQLG